MVPVAYTHLGFTVGTAAHRRRPNFIAQFISRKVSHSNPIAPTARRLDCTISPSRRSEYLAGILDERGERPLCIPSERERSGWSAYATHPQKQDGIMFHMYDGYHFWGMHMLWWLFWLAFISVIFGPYEPVRRNRRSSDTT